VLEGLDSSGKATQARLLEKRLKEKGIKTRIYSFPRYNSLFGKLIGRYLKGEFGKKENIPQEFVSILYSLDRYEIKNEIESLLKKGFVVLMDRYYTSNFAFQGAKFKGKKKKEFMKWIKKLESRMPSPNAVFFLDVPVEVSQNLMKTRKQKNYMKTKKDIHEKDIMYQKRVRKTFIELCKQEKNWMLIKCMHKGKLKNIKEINDLLWKKMISL
jgi:dTMP kinase